MDKCKRRRIASSSTVNNENTGKEELPKNRRASSGGRLNRENKENIQSRYALRSSQNQSLNLKFNDPPTVGRKRSVLNDLKNHLNVKQTKSDSENVLLPTTSDSISQLTENISIDTKNVTFRDQNLKHFERKSPDGTFVTFRTFSNENLCTIDLATTINAKADENSHEVCSDQQEKVPDSANLLSTPTAKPEYSPETEVIVSNSLLLEKARSWKFSPFQSESKDDSDTPNLLILVDGIPSLKKKTLKKDLIVPTNEPGVIDLDPNDGKLSVSILYAYEYLDEMAANYLRKEDLRMSQNKDQSGIALSVIPEIQTMVVNWLLKLQQHFRSDVCVFFSAVQLLDTVLKVTYIPPGEMQVVGLAAYWIAMKHSDLKCVPKVRLFHSRYLGPVRWQS